MYNRNCFQVAKYLVLFDSLIPVALCARLDIFLQVENMRLLVSLDQWKCMAKEAQTLVVTCEYDWMFLLTAIKPLSGELP
jgi:hypothetical protein